MLKNTAALLALFGGFRMALFPIPIITLFWKDQIGMSMSDIMLLQAIFAVASVLLEFPSGYIADHFGHRTSLLAGACLWIAGWTIYALAATFPGMVAAEVLLGAGMAFASGADSALLFTTLEAEERVSDYSRWEGRVRAVSQGSEAVSSAVGGYLYAMNPRLPFWMQIPPAVLALGTALLMKETAASIRPRRPSHLGQAWWIVRHTLVRHARLRSAVFLSATLGLSTFVMVWLIQPYMQSHGIPAAGLGPLWAAAHVYLAVVSLFSARAAASAGATTVLLGCCALIGMGYAGLAFGKSAWAIAFYLCFMTVRGLQGPILAGVIQHDAPGDLRASVLSLNALVFRLGFAVIGPPVGVLVDRIGLDSALVWLGIAFTSVSLIAFAVFRRAHRVSPSGGRSSRSLPDRP